MQLLGQNTLYLIFSDISCMLLASWDDRCFALNVSYFCALWIGERYPVVNSDWKMTGFFLYYSLGVMCYITFILPFSLHSLCVYIMSMSSIWVNTPAIFPSCPPYSASLYPSNSPGACGRLLPFRQRLWLLPIGVRWLSCVMCICVSPCPPPPLSLPLLLVLLGITCRRGPAVKKHWFRF